MPMRGTLKEVYTADFMPPVANDFIGRLKAQIPLLDVVWGDGTDANELDDWWVTYLEGLNTGANDDWDLRSLSGGPRGAVTFGEVRAIFLHTDTDLIMTVGAATPWTALGAAFLINIKAGTYFRYICPTDGELPVSGSDKILRITNSSGAAAVYSLAIFGVTA